MKINWAIKKLVETNKLYVISVTSDNGLEFEKIGILTKWLNCKVYYCNHYASYQRGSNENINGLVRRLYKKGTNFNEISDQEIYELQEKINNMPRRIHCIIFLKNLVALEIAFRDYSIYLQFIFILCFD